MEFLEGLTRDSLCVVENLNLKMSASKDNSSTTQQVSLKKSLQCEFHSLLKCSSSLKQVGSQARKMNSSKEKEPFGTPLEEERSGIVSLTDDGESPQREVDLGGEVAVGPDPNFESPTTNNNGVVVSALLHDCQTFLETSHGDSTFALPTADRFATKACTKWLNLPLPS